MPTLPRAPSRKKFGMISENRDYLAGTGTTLEESVRKALKYNITFNLLDGAFYGLGWGFGSVGTIITLFVSRMTHSAVLIGLIPAIHAVGWQLPQLFMAPPALDSSTQPAWLPTDWKEIIRGVF